MGHETRTHGEKVEKHSLPRPYRDMAYRYRNGLTKDLGRGKNNRVCYLVCSGVIVHMSTVKPPNKGHFGDGPVVPCREVVLFSEVFF